MVWEEERTILDGHHRFAICQQYDIPYPVHLLSLPDLDAAKAWMLTHQLGRRNLTPEQMSYLRGKQYAVEKRQHGGDRKSKGKSFPLHDSTAAQLAEHHKVTDRTIKNDAAFAEALDTLAADVRADIRAAVLQRTPNGTQPATTKKQVTQAGKLVQDHAVEPLPFMRREAGVPRTDPASLPCLMHRII